MCVFFAVLLYEQCLRLLTGPVNRPSFDEMAGGPHQPTVYIPEALLVRAGSGLHAITKLSAGSRRRFWAIDSDFFAHVFYEPLSNC